nr:HAMP domain-containing sensor histidine kinase [uncultured Gemmiger sp.]
MNTENRNDRTWPENYDLLRGGLKGRLAEDFCVLQGTVDALTRYLEQQAPEPVRSTGLDTLQEMSRRIRRLERLADNAADLALGSQLRRLRAPLPLELTGHLQSFCACAQEELAACGHPARVQLQDETADGLWLEADDALVNSLLANLVSNSVRAGADAVDLTCTADRCLIYRDNGPGADPAVLELLMGDSISGKLLNCGGTGLLLVREYAAALGWSVQAAAEENTGFAVTFALPEHCPDPSQLVLADDSGQKEQARALCRYRLHREFAAVLGETKE